MHSIQQRVEYIVALSFQLSNHDRNSNRMDKAIQLDLHPQTKILKPNNFHILLLFCDKMP